MTPTMARIPIEVSNVTPRFAERADLLASAIASDIELRIAFPSFAFNRYWSAD
jgi:hypothetical protein